VVSNVLASGESAWIGVNLSQAASYALGYTPEGLEAVSDLHVTLAYLGVGEQVTIDRDDLLMVAEWIAESHYVHSAKIGGSFRFYDADLSGPEAIGYLVDSETLSTMRASLVSELVAMGQYVSRSGGFVPHVTLGYTLDSEMSIPTPGIDRFAVQSVTVHWGEESISFELRGELGAPYMPLNQKEEEEMSEELKIKANENEEEVLEAPSVEEPETPSVPEIDGLEEFQSFMAEVKEAGGVAAIMEAIGKLAANESARRAGAVERIKSQTDQFSDAELDGMTTETIEKWADILSASKVQGLAANYGANVGGVSKPDSDLVSVPGIGELRPFSSED
jgi:2'-5' RNA ligase